MAFRRNRRRRRNGMWLPVLGSGGLADSSGGTSEVLWGLQGKYTSPANGLVVNTIIQALVPDTSFLARASAAVAGLNSWDQEINQYGWMCKRILGTYRVGYPQAEGNYPRALLWGVGLFVAPEAPTQESFPAGASGASFLSDASAANEASFEAFSPLANTGTTFPWMWRKQWILENENTTNDAYPVLGFPQSNTRYTGVISGDSVDVKTRRHIRPGERLYFATSYVAFPFDNIDYSTVVVPWRLDTRVYGSLTKPKLPATFR